MTLENVTFWLVVFGKNALLAIPIYTLFHSFVIGNEVRMEGRDVMSIAGLNTTFFLPICWLAVDCHSAISRYRDFAVACYNMFAGFGDTVISEARFIVANMFCCSRIEKEGFAELQSMIRCFSDSHTHDLRIRVIIGLTLIFFVYRILGPFDGRILACALGFCSYALFAPLNVVLETKVFLKLFGDFIQYGLVGNPPWRSYGFMKVEAVFI